MMGETVKRFLRSLSRLLARLGGLDIPAMSPAYPGGAVPGIPNRMQQVQLMEAYRALAGGGTPQDFMDIGFDVFSQTYEDGILLYIFSVIGMVTRRCVDIGSAGIVNSNTANLIINHAFEALLIDGDISSVQAAGRFYGSHPSTGLCPPRVVHEFVSAENVNSVVAGNAFTGEIDLLCIDIDGNDYWIWRALDAVSPRVVLVEYQDILGPDRSWTIPYRADFNRYDYEVNREHMNYGGASLMAFVKLAAEKGYRLVGCSRGGWNAFFVKEPLGDNQLPAVSVESCFRFSWNNYGMRERFPLVCGMKWQEV